MENLLIVGRQPTPRGCRDCLAAGKLAVFLYMVTPTVSIVRMAELIEAAT